MLMPFGSIIGFGLLIVAAILAIRLFGWVAGAFRSTMHSAYNAVTGTNAGVPATSSARPFLTGIQIAGGLAGVILAGMLFMAFVSHSPAAWVQTALNGMQQVANFSRTYQSSDDTPLIPAPPPPAPASMAGAPEAARINAAIRYFRIRMVELPSGKIIPDSEYIFEAAQGETRLEKDANGKVRLVIPPHPGRIATISNPADSGVSWTVNVRRADGSTYRAVIGPGAHCNEVVDGWVELNK